MLEGHYGTTIQNINIHVKHGKNMMKTMIRGTVNIGITPQMEHLETETNINMQSNNLKNE